jgi:RecB family exonuclease
MIKWSFSGLKDFTTCPRQYNEVKIHKRFTKKVTEQMNYGTVVHKALEDYVRDGIPLAKNYERYRAMVDPLLEIEGTRHPELKMALREDKTPCDFDAPDYWVRGIVDFLVIDGDTAYIVDYKTGSARYPDLKQLKLMALMTFAHHPSVRKIKAGLLFVAHNMFIDESYNKADIDYLWEFFTPSLTRLRIAMDTDTWTANPSPLCGWCPVTTCQYNKG